MRGRRDRLQGRAEREGRQYEQRENASKGTHEKAESKERRDQPQREQEKGQE